MQSPTIIILSREPAIAALDGALPAHWMSVRAMGWFQSQAQAWLDDEITRHPKTTIADLPGLLSGASLFACWQILPRDMMDSLPAWTRNAVRDILSTLRLSVIIHQECHEPEPTELTEGE